MTTPKSNHSHLEQRFEHLWYSLALDLPLVSQKTKVVPGRRYVYDFFEPKSGVLFEINGGIHARGKSGHSSAAGILRDYDKLNQGQLQGYTVFLLAPEQLTKDYIQTLVEYCRANQNNS